MPNKIVPGGPRPARARAASAELPPLGQRMIEKHGGFWVERNDAYSRCVYEAYEKDVDVLATVHTDSENLFIAQVHKKVPDYQWILPVWGGDQVEALFDNEADAIAHVRKVIANMKHPGHE